ncbi:MAG TPA: hypothetical protein VMB51_08120 [Solirubrobacteraceae bacterium]|nr:hypothetical protein [Solirubrobacteraceae bacterium]
MLLLTLIVALGAQWSSSTVAAEAEISHEFITAIAQAPPGTNLSEPQVVAVDHATGQLFVGDPLAGYVDVFSASGEYETRFGDAAIEPVGIAIDEANGDVYVAEPLEAAVLVYEPDGSGGYRLLSQWRGASTPGKAFGEVVGVAFDNSTSPGDPAAGDLYVVEREGIETEGHGAVDLYKPMPNPPSDEEAGEEGEYVGRLAGVKLEEPNAIAVDSQSGRVLVAESGSGAIVAFSDHGAYEAKFTGKGQPYGSFLGKEGEVENVAALAVDEASGDIYVAEAEHRAISQYDPAGEWLGTTTTGESQRALQEPRGIALTAGAQLYGVDSGTDLVDLFGSGVVVPDVTTLRASKLARTSALVGGVIDGDGEASKYSFQWGSSEELGQSTGFQSAGAGEEKVSATLEGLQAGATYYFRIVGAGENGISYGLVHEFHTLAAVQLETGTAKEITTDGATLAGSILPDGFETNYHFEWGTSIGYGNETGLTSAGAGSGAVEATATLADLQPNTTYHYRLVGQNQFGVTIGADRSLTTSGPPRIATEAPTELTHTSATLHAKLNADKLATTYRFQYGETAAYGLESPVGGASIGEGGSPVAVSAALSGLRIGTVYHYRVLAENSAGTTAGPDETFESVPPAPVNASYVTEVGTTEATLHAEIDPLGNPTAYYFQYGEQRCRTTPSACTDVPAPPTEVGSGTTDVPESETIDDLQPATTYYYRVLATNSLGTTEGPEHSFTTGAQASSFALADGRAWEMVSPPDKHGAPIEALTREGGVILASADGDSLTYVVDGAFGEEAQGNRSPEMEQIMAVRGPQAWSSEDIATPNSRAYGDAPGSAPEYQFFSPSLGMALVEPFGPEPPLSPEATQKTIYLRDQSTAAFAPLVTEANVPPGTEFGGQLHFVEATPDLAHIVLQSTVPLAEAPAGKGLYEWSAGKLKFVSVLPDGAPSPSSALGFGGHVVVGAVSDDGSRVIWQDKAEGTALGHLYLRDTETEETIQLDAAQGVAEPESGAAEFQGASSSGSKVFFTDKQRLTQSSTAEPAGKPDLYECEVSEVAGRLGCHLSDLTVDRGEAEHADVQGLVLAVSEGGEDVYLVAQGVLASNENGVGQRAEPGHSNLYLLHESGGEWTTTFIAGLSSEDSPEWEGNKEADSAFVTARVSPNGRYFAFMSAAPLTGYDNVDQNSGEPDEEVFLYDSATDGLSCVSCNPSGARPVGVLDTVESGEGLGLLVDRRKVWAAAGHEHWLAGNIPGWTAKRDVSAVLQSRYLSNEGRLFFNSPDDLVAQATNHKEDVYEYEPSGVGSCVSSSGACISLISSGSSSKESAFLEATPSGNDVFFLTAAQLLSQDTDTAFDIYDARVCTELSPCLTPPESAPPGCRDADGCRPAQPAQPSTVAPATESASGSGNVATQRGATAKQQTQAAKKTRSLTLAQRLEQALAACRKHHPHSKQKRQACERQARKRFRPKHTSKKTKRSAPKRPRGTNNDPRTGSRR